MNSQAEVIQSRTYLFRGHPYFYATLVDFPKMGLLQVHSDWGTYSHFWSSIGDQSLAEFLVDCDSSYVQGKLAVMLNFMGMKKDASRCLVSFMAHCWPRLIEKLKEEVPR